MDTTHERWFKSSYSGGLENNCVEVADALDIVPVRDSKNLGPVVAFSAPRWMEFIAALKTEEF
ncbi:DUF397 domain-containing protein [Streptomyces sp. B1866]|uniref:DUF397 domain-containing protein n=1 Tax=Streptomyces sp. B1866 TaxID=3075431 RepID=UPI00288E328C|nr:DUF397 domain-containing protein [Streptomyces sp. B1866]MDT3397465.1 DUF397 domain-containing protein [Streptomyces sp. B1866]